jgi:phage shock protein A
MTIVERISTLVRANINDLLDRAEDPEKLIKQLLMDMHSQLLQAKTQVAAAIADEKLLFERYQENQAQADEWQRKAELAVSQGADDLARQALMRRAAFQQTADGLKTQRDAQSRQVEMLKEVLGQLQAKITEAETKQGMLIARSHRAQAETHIRAPLAGVEASGALASFERMEDKIDQQEAGAAALREMESDSLTTRLTEIDTAGQVERELAALKARQAVPAPTPAPALPAE